jgi:hypothetical protein
VVALSKDVERAAQKWFEGLPNERRLRVALLVLFHSTSLSERTKIFGNLGLHEGDDRRFARESGGFLGCSHFLYVAHPSYREGILRSLRNDHLLDASKVLRSAAANLDAVSFMSVSRIRIALRILKREQVYFEHQLPAETIDPVQYYRRYIRSRNEIINQDFPALKRELHKGSEDADRVHLYITPDDRVAGWTIFPRWDDQPEVTISEDFPNYAQNIYSAAEREVMEHTRMFTTGVRHDSSHLTTIPEAEAFADMEDDLSAIFSGGHIFGLSRVLDTAHLYKGLKSVGFPIDKIDEINPLTSAWIKEWCGPFLENDRVSEIFTDPERRKHAYRYSADAGIVNDLNIHWAINFVNEMIANGFKFCDSFLTTPDCPWESPAFRFNTLSRSDIFTDARIVEAVRNGIVKEYQAVRESLLNAFPTLHHRFETQWLMSSEMLCIIDRTHPDSMSRPTINYGIRRTKAVGGRNELSISVHLVSPRSTQDEINSITALREDMYGGRGGYSLVGFRDFDTLIDFKKWHMDVLQSIARVLTDHIKSEEHRLLRFT